MASITTHVIDIACGSLARRVPLLLKKNGLIIAEGVTQEDGRSPPSFFSRGILDSGIYVLHFNVSYYSAGKGAAFFPEIVIQFDVANGAHDYHVPLLLSHFGYSTYRGC